VLLLPLQVPGVAMTLQLRCLLVGALLLNNNCLRQCIMSPLTPQLYLLAMQLSSQHSRLQVYQQHSTINK
jgi:hypothetical protein